MKSELKHKVIRSIFIAIVFVLFLLMFWPFFTSILLAGLFAFALHDTVSRMSSKKLGRKTASILLMVAIVLFIATPLLFITLTTITTVKEYSATGIQHTSIFQWTIQLVHEVTDYAANIAQKLHFDTSNLPKATDYLGDLSSVAGVYATKLLTALPHLGLSLVVFFLSFYYFLNESDQVKSFILGFDLISESEMNKIIAVVKKSSFRTLIASLIIASAQALVIAIFAYFCGYTDFFLVFIVCFVFALIPVIGSAPVSIFLVLISFIQGNSEAGFAMIIAFIIASSLDNVIKPFILNTSADDIHPIVALLALVGAILVYGPPGILLGPVLTQLAFNILSILKTEEKSGENQLITGL